MVITNNVIAMAEDDTCTGPGVKFLGKIMQDVLFANNVVDVQNNSCGLDFQITDTMRRITIANNNIKSVKACISFYTYCDYGNDFIIRGNQLTSKTSRGVGGYQAPDMRNCIISDNIIMSPLRCGIELGTVSGSWKNTQVQNNLIYYWKSTSGVSINNATYTVVKNNILSPLTEVTTTNDNYTANDSTDWQEGDIVNDNAGGTIWGGEIAMIDAANKKLYIDLKTGVSTDILAANGIRNITRNETDTLTARVHPDSTPFYVNAGRGNVVSGNIGYTTSNSGTATVTGGSTFVNVAHGLSITPTIANIRVTPTNNLGNATMFWLSNVGATTFRINVDADPGAAATFTWAIVD
jgi:hypothetical protein